MSALALAVNAWLPRHRFMDMSPDGPTARRTSSTGSTPLDAHSKRTREDEDALDAILAEPPSKRLELTQCQTPSCSPDQYEQMPPATRFASVAFGTPISGHPISCPLATELRLRFAAAQTVGQRSHMEDRTVCKLEDHIHLPHGYFAIFDGHGGFEAAEHCAEHLHRNVLSSEYFPDFLPALQDGYLRTDASFLQCAAMSNRRKSNAGAAAVTCLVTASHLTLAHAGDCRAILIRRLGTDPDYLDLTKDHTADDALRPDEIARVRQAGAETHSGYVFVGEDNLPMTRAFGNLRLKVGRGCDWRHLSVSEQVVTALPEVSVYTRSAHDLAVVIASDGLFGDVMSSEDVAELVRNELQAIRNQSSDNVSVVVISLEAPDLEALSQSVPAALPQGLVPPEIDHLSSETSISTQGFSPGRSRGLDQELKAQFGEVYPCSPLAALSWQNSDSGRVT